MGTGSDWLGRASEYEQRAGAGAGAGEVSSGDMKFNVSLWWRLRQIVVTVKPCIGCSLDLNIFWAVTVE